VSTIKQRWGARERIQEARAEVTYIDEIAVVVAELVLDDPMGRRNGRRLH
jgi:hypothetical protein